MRKHYRVVSIPRFVTFIVLCTLLLLTAIYNIGGIYMANARTACQADRISSTSELSPEPKETDLYTEITVSSGDTLWSIAGNYYGSQVDKRKAVYQIQDMNHMTDTSLRAGQVLKLPKNV